jgi:hypothetical protein
VTEDDWFRFVVYGKPPVVSITRLTPDLCRVLECGSSLVQMSHEYALKGKYRHQIEPYRLPMIGITIDCGRVVQDRSHALTFFYYEPVVFSHWFQVSVKRNAEATENWVTTFHQASAAEVARMSKKYGIIRSEII